MSSGAGMFASLIPQWVENNFLSGSQRRAYLSRWKLVLKDYNALRAQLFNSAGLLEETNLALYVINQTTLVSKIYL